MAKQFNNAVLLIAGLSLSLLLSLVLAPTVYLAAEEDLSTGFNQKVLFDKTNASGKLTGESALVPMPSGPRSMSLNASASNTTIISGGPDSNRVHMVFLADGYLEAEQQAFNNRVNAVVADFFKQSPLYAYQDYFNIHRVNIVSPESGATNYPVTGVARSTAIGSYLNCQEDPDTLCTDVGRAWSYAALSPGADQIVVLVNINSNGASAYPFSSLAVIAEGNTRLVDSLLHQVGHSFANLADEYNSGKWPVYTGFEPAEPNVSAQNESAMLAQKLKWYKWLGYEGSGLSAIGAYEGALGHSEKIYRPTWYSKMSSLDKPFNSPSQEAFVKQIYKRVKLIDDSTPQIAGLSGSNTFFISHPVPLHGDLKIQWFLDDQPINGANSSKFRPNDYPLTNGPHVLKVVIKDNTNLVRDEEFRNIYMVDERLWNVNISQHAPVILDNPKDLSRYVGETARFSVSASGDDLKYQWFRNGDAISGATSSSYALSSVSKTDSGSKFTVEVRNVAGAIISTPANLNILNRTPAFQGISNQTMYRGERREFAIMASDPDGDVLNYSASVENFSGNSGAIISFKTPSLFEIANGNAFIGSYKVNYGVSDGTSTVSGTFQVNVINRAPVIDPVALVNRRPGHEPFVIPLNYSDPDGDPVTMSAAITQPNSKLSLTSVNNGVRIAADPAYIGTFGVRVTVNDGMSSTQIVFYVSISNGNPVISAIPLQYMHWREGTKRIQVNATDPDGDTLTYRAELVTLTNSVSLAMTGSEISVTPKPDYFGTFHAKVIVSDGFASSERQFSMTVGNVAPTMAIIPEQSVHWRKTSLQLSLPVSDTDVQDRDFLTCSASLLGSLQGVNLSVDRCNLSISMQNTGTRTFSIRVSASDGNRSSNPQDFTVRVFNNSPNIQAISDQEVGREVLEHQVAVVASDPDGEEITYAVETVPPGSSSVALSMNGSSLKIVPTEGFVGSVPVRVSVSDGLAKASTQFLFSVTNYPPVLTALPDQYLHWVKDRTRSLQLDAVDPDNSIENLIFSAEIVGNAPEGASVVTEGRELEINLPERYLGNFSVKVTVNDGEFSDSGIFTVYSANAPPVLTQPCDREFEAGEVVKEVVLEGIDPDEEELIYEARSEHYNLPYELRQKYNFQLSGTGYFYNLTGQQEKYLRGTLPGQSSQVWFAILPSGKLYEWRGSTGSSTLIAELPEAYHIDPKLLTQVSAPVGEVPVSVEIEDNRIIFDPSEQYLGTFIVHARVKDAQLFDEKSFLVSIYGSSLYIEAPSILKVHWRENNAAFRVITESFEEQAETNYEISFADTSAAHNIATVHGFSNRLSRVAYRADNASGRGEKYFVGTRNTQNFYLYSILPTGEVFQCNGSLLGGSIADSIYIGSVSPVFYQNIEYLSQMPPAGLTAVTLSNDDSYMRVLPVQGFVGVALMRVTARKGGAVDYRDVLLDVYNDAPTITNLGNLNANQNPAFNFSWKEAQVIISSKVVENNTRDEYHLTGVVREGNVAQYYTALSNFKFNFNPSNTNFNSDGFREKRFTAVHNGTSITAAILPSGAVYHWNGSVASSSLLARLPASYYVSPALLNSLSALASKPNPVGADVSINGKNIVVKPPANFTGTIPLMLEFTDGDAVGTADFSVTFVNNPPVIPPIQAVSRHIRSEASIINNTSFDPDNDDLNYSIEAKTSDGRIAPASVSVDRSVIAIQNSLFFKGSFGVRLAVSDGTNSVSRDIPVTVYNNKPRLAPIGTRVVGWENNSVEISVSTSDPDPEDQGRLLIRAYAGTPRHHAYLLDKEYDFKFSSRAPNSLNLGEKYIEGTRQGAPQSFAILPGGGLYKINGTNIEPNAVTFLPEEYYRNPALLFDVVAPENLPAASVNVVNNLISLNLAESRFTGTIPLTVYVSDGYDTDYQTVQVSFVNSAPVVSQIPNRVFHWRQAIPLIPVTATDVNGDTLQISAQNIGGLPISLSVEGSSIRAVAAENQVGMSLIRVLVSDGTNLVTNQFSLTLTNTAPRISSMGAIQVGWRESISRQITATDADNDPLTVSAAAAAESSSLIDVTLINRELRVTPKSPFNGTARVIIRASDGPATAESSLYIQYENKAPVLSHIPDQQMHWRNSSISIPLSVSDLDGDTLTLSAIQTSGQPLSVSKSLSPTQMQLTFIEPPPVLGTYNWKVTASDSNKTADRSFALKVTNRRPLLVGILNQTIEKGVESVSVAVEGSDPDSDPLTYSASLYTENAIASELAGRYKFYQSSGNHDFNKLGNNEKYFYGKDPVTNLLKTFVLYPGGRLYEWSGQLTSSTFIGSIPTRYYDDPSLLFAASGGSPGQEGWGLNLTAGTLTISPPKEFEGSRWIRVSATDTREETHTYFEVSVVDPSDRHDEVPDSSYSPCDLSAVVHNGEYSVIGATAFVAEGRIGDTVTGSGNRTFEVGISKSTAGPFDNGETDNHVWKSGEWVNFDVSYDKNSEKVTFTLGGTKVSHNASFANSISDILIRGRATPADTSIEIDSLSLGSESLSAPLVASPALGGVKTMHIAAGARLKDSFELKGRVKLNFKTSLVVPKNSELAFQVTFVTTDKALPACDVTDGKKVTICHIPPGNPSNAKTISVAVAALEAHLAHGDVIGECPGQPNDPGDGVRTCEEKKLFTSPNYTLWNSFLGMINILELTNSSAVDSIVKLQFYSILGALQHQVQVRVPANNQFDVIVNEFPGFVADSYGLIKLEFEGALDGRMMYYRPAQGSDGTNYDYAYGMPLNDASYGTTAVGFNTYQPSLKESERGNLVANWLSIVNLDQVSQRYLVFTYDASGVLIMRREIEVPSFGRADVDGGHDVAGAGVVGYHKIIPRNVTAQYIAQITRFGGNAPAGFAPSAYKFAFPLMARMGQSDQIYLPISNKFGETNWIEVVNILDRPAGAVINYYASDGRVLESVDALIPANAQMHFHASQHLSAGTTGFAMITPKENFSIVAQSMGYLREAATGSVTSVYGSQARRAVPCVQSGSYNLYLGMQNWLLVGNPTNETVEATLRLTGPSMITDKVLVLSPKASVLIPIHDSATYRTAPDTYGLLAVYPKIDSVRLFTEVVRVRYRSDGTPDFSVPIPVR